MKSYLHYVNIKQGTKSSRRFSNGNTLPLVQRPFGFASFAPQTDSSRGAWFYHPEDRSFEGIRLTHQPSPWIRDHGAIVIQPQNETPCMKADRRWSGFSEEVLLPHYLKYVLTRTKAEIELTPTVYGACVRMNFTEDVNRYFSVLPVCGFCSYRFEPETNRLYCETDCNEYNEFESGKFKAYFVFQFDESAVDLQKCLIEDEEGLKRGTAVRGEHTAIHLFLKKKTVTVMLAESYISYEQAVRNLCQNRSFDSLKEENEQIWNSYLGRIEIKAEESVLKTFYSCMYRVFLFPHTAYELNEGGEPVHYAPSDGTIKKGVRYTDNGFWDTYRTVYPLFAMIAREEYKEILEGFLADYREVGWLPCWTALGPKNCMPSTLIDAVLADAAVKGILTGDSLRLAFEGMEHHANTPSPIAAFGRAGCEQYNILGYVPCDREKESVNLTLDAAYCDWCLSVVAELLGEKEKARYYESRSKNYRNLFDKQRGFMVGRKSDGTFREKFDPFSWGGDYTEASAWQTSFAVQHDLEGLAELYGGKEEFLKMLDTFFQTPPAFCVGGYGHEIHEMTEFMAGSWGQCAICNQPSFHIPFLYAYFGEPEKTGEWVKKICREGFSHEDDGFPGDEDNGSMAAWYLFAAMGLYPLCPGKKESVSFPGLAEKVKILGKKIKNEKKY